MYDQEKKKSRGFGFLSFENDTAVDRATADHFVNLNGKQVEIKKAEPRDGSSQNNSMSMESYQWGSSAAPMGNGGQMGGPPMNMPMGMNQGYQQFSAQQQGYGGYGGNAAAAGSAANFQGWGAPPAQWGNSAYNPQQSQGYSAYDSYGTYNSTTANAAAAANAYGSGNWSSWNVPAIPNSGATGSTTGDMYSRPQSGAPTAGGPPGNNLSKPGSDYGAGGYGAQYAGNYYSEQQQQQFSRPRSAYSGANEGTPAQSYAAF